jgi:hypothetical protein
LKIRHLLNGVSKQFTNEAKLFQLWQKCHRPFP